MWNLFHCKSKVASDLLPNFKVWVYKVVSSRCVMHVLADEQGATLRLPALLLLPISKQTQVVKDAKNFQLCTQANYVPDSGTRINDDSFTTVGSAPQRLCT